MVISTSKSVYPHQPAVRNVADLTFDSYFASRNDPGQWVSWDFHEMSVPATHYTIKGYWLKSWVVESSLNGTAWTEIDRKTDNDDFKGDGLVCCFGLS
jgi:hypothetical protein